MNVKKLYVAVALIISFGLGFSVSYYFFVFNQKLHSSAISFMKMGKPVAIYEKKNIVGKDYIDKVKRYDSSLSSDTIIRRCIDDYIIISEFDKLGLHKSEKYQVYLNEKIKKSIVDYYLDFIITVKQDDNNLLSAVDIDKIYEENIELFSKNNLTKKQSYDLIMTMLLSENKKILEKNSRIFKSIELLRLRKEYNIKLKN